MAKKKLWGGRFEANADALVETLGQSISFDARLAPWDIRASIAHARMLGDQGIIAQGDAAKIVRGLTAIGKDIEAGRFTWDPALEDVHTNIEAALVERIGDAGKRLHTARSRNDQVATDTRLWARDQVEVMVDLISGLQRALVGFAEAHLDVVLPGYTHLQHAQPVLLAHHILAFFEMFERDRTRLLEARARINVMPLGAAALAGTPYPIDRRHVAKALGFDSIADNSMDAVSDRDFLIELLADIALAMMHLSRLCDELILWSTPEFGFIEIGDAFTTGSSIMPQKKNPDVAELIRGKTGRVYGDLMALLTTMKGLPLTYNRDLQEDKERAFDAVDTLQLALAVMTRMLPSICVNREAMAEAAREGFMEATDLADYLVTQGLPFREAHEIVGKIVLQCIREARRLGDLSIEELQRFSPLFGGSVCARLSPDAVIRKRATHGGTAPRQVRRALRRAQRLLELRKRP
ncbi:MAG TPA: argininosuccinate lyase [Candidatus Hydrogenedentes bacterium]|nr:argininosuccinate lyase [Candidatus Hydrogenedentota bacterium]HPG66750.1 argininosuccinate lyase [Candidatus Hydrogenedentota bacterium]